MNEPDELSAKEMLQIAKELKGFVSEVGYITPLSPTEYDLKYYSSERELDFCGHVTIATMYDIINTNQEISMSACSASCLRRSSASFSRMNRTLSMLASISRAIES